jgi:PilZ domain
VHTETKVDAIQKEALEVISMLDRWSDRLEGHYTQKRTSQRKSFRSRITIYIPSNDSLAGESEEATSFQAWARNISQSGLAFLYKGNIKLDKIIVCLDPDTKGIHWLNAEFVRIRQVHNDFWEYGVKFTGRQEM